MRLDSIPEHPLPFRDAQPSPALLFRQPPRFRVEVVAQPPPRFLPRPRVESQVKRQG